MLRIQTTGPEDWGTRQFFAQLFNHPFSSTWPLKLYQDTL